MPKQVTLLRSGNRLVVSPSTPAIVDALTPSLRYTEKVASRGAERARRVRASLPLVDEVEWEMYAEDHKGRLATSYGFRELITDVLAAKGYAVTEKWATKTEAARRAELARTAYAARWDRIEEHLKNGFEFRYKQRRALELMAKHENGRIDCHPGWGKGTIITLAAMLFPKAKIDVVTKRVQILHTRLYPELAANLPSVGVIGGGKRVTGRRVMCVSADSLHHGRPDADFVFVDEAHEACADGYAEKLGVYDHARMWGFSGSWDMRFDNKDMRGVAIFGPIRLRVPYQKGVEHGIVVPIEVHWSDVIMDENPCSGLSDDTARKRAGVWANEYRNAVIARDARAYRDDQQVLITVETVEHALNLAKLLPEFRVVYSGQGLKESDLRWFRKHYPDQFVEMTQRRLGVITRKFEKGTIKKAIATTVWNVGVDFRHLEVLLRADAGGSAINDVQIPGRTSRKKRAEDVERGARAKFVGIVRDYLDQFDTGFARRAWRREVNYVRNGWAQAKPDAKSWSALRRRLDMGE